MKINDRFASWPKSANENFAVVDDLPTIGHVFCVTPKHVAYAADHCHGILGEDALEHSGVPCGICKRPYEDHKEQGLLIYCTKNPQTDSEAHDELVAFLNAIKERTLAEGYAGFAFVAGWGK